MTEKPRKPPGDERGFADRIGATAARKLKARRNATPGLWSGLGVMGVIGWSVTVPTLLGAALGLWLDGHGWSRHSWTLALLAAGLSIGCLNAWHWVVKEQRAIHDGEEH
jgi:ATP synthase protein I